MTTTDAYRLGHAHGATLDPSAHLAACDAGWAPGMSSEFIDDYNAGFNAGWDEAGLANGPAFPLVHCAHVYCSARFCYVPERAYPELCLDHAAEVSRSTGWNPANSVD